MPLIAVNLSDKLIQDIRELVETGRYLSLESFVEIGAFNQLALERGATPSEIIERGHRRITVASEAAPSVRSPPKKPVSSPAPKRIPLTEKAPKDESVLSVGEDEAGTVFARLGLPDASALPPAAPMPSEPVTGDRIFGQVNRLFPVKFVCRWLANAGAVGGHWPRFSAVSDQLADDAGVIGSLLDEWDNTNERERGGELATALPRRKNNASLDRFLSQFVARITRASDVVPGAVCQYDLARFDADAALALTEQGASFAELSSPVLDAKDRKATSALSIEEAAFLTAHIRHWVPTEWADMRTVLQAVRDGNSTPTDVATTVRSALPEGWTESMVQTHISGVIARLSDIRLLRRSWQGRNVRYELGDAAQVTSFLDS